MITKLINEINSLIINYIPEYPIISQDIDKNNIYPCFKVNVISHNLNRITERILEYNYSLAVNFYPDHNLDNRILLLSVAEKLNEIFSFDFKNWQVINKEVLDNEDFITCLLDYKCTKIFENETKLIQKDNNLIDENEYKIIEKIENKEEI